MYQFIISPAGNLDYNKDDPAGYYQNDIKLVSCVYYYYIEKQEYQVLLVTPAGFVIE